MVIIFSDNTDYTTTHVLYWMQHFNITFKVITPESNVSFSRFTNQRFTFCINDEEICSDDITGVWYRRGEFIYGRNTYNFQKLSPRLIYSIDSERRNCLNYIHKVFDKFPTKIGSFSGNFINRLEVLNKAERIGLCTPEFLVTDSRAELDRFFLKHKYTGIVLKNFSDGIGFHVEDRFYKFYTQKIDIPFINNLPAKFPCCLLMQYIDKVFEIRTFIFLDKVFSMAILDFSSNVDIKKGEKTNSVRYAPFHLPVGISKKLVNLVRQLKIETGSVDLLVDRFGKFYFLEINPIGQFGHLSKVCNIYLEKLIAQYFYEKARVL